MSGMSLTPYGDQHSSYTLPQPHSMPRGRSAKNICRHIRSTQPSIPPG